jgi:chromosomal replication initiation ATPase DnaA
MTIWDQILDRVRNLVSDEDYRRWFGSTAYASDSGDQITVWVPTETIRRHMVQNFDETVRQAVAAVGRRNTHVRFVVGGTDEDEDDDS